MLAEPRNRLKWSSNPRGNTWSNDGSKFGQKLMEKMGWEKGKGLGANEDGRREHVKVTFKADNRGVGCSVNHADKWIAHQDDFNSLLSNLAATHSAPGSTCASGDESEPSPKVQSLEQKSKHSKGRMHYMKFTKGKDLSRYGERDMDSILGKRKSNSSRNTPQQNSEANSDADDGSQSQVDNKTNLDKTFGVQTITSGTSVQEYFARKMAELKRTRLQDDGNLSSVKSESGAGLGATPARDSFETLTSEGDLLQVNSIEDSGKEGISLKKHKKKRKKQKSKDNESCVRGKKTSSEDIEDGNEAREVHGQQGSQNGKKRKKLDAASVEDTESKYMNLGFNYDEPPVKKKKSKKKKRELVEQQKRCLSPGENDKKYDDLTVDRKSKKVRCTSQEVVSQDVTLVNQETSVSKLAVSEENVTNIAIDVRDDASSIKEKKKKRKSRETVDTGDNEVVVEDSVNMSEIAYSGHTKIGKKKKKSKSKAGGATVQENDTSSCGFPNSNIGHLPGYGGGINIGYSLKKV